MYKAMDPVPKSIMDKRLVKIKTVENILDILREKGRSLSNFKRGDTIYVWNKMQKGYSYTLEESPGKNLGFVPYTNPGEILACGAFGGRYMNDCLLEFPCEWFLRAALLGKLSPGGSVPLEVNYFKTDSGLSLSQWRENGWVPSSVSAHDPSEVEKFKDILANPLKNPDERGWFQWYCRYWMGRRIPELDAVQIYRFHGFKRHYGGVKKNCSKGDLECRVRQRQALLHWAWKFDL